MYKETAKWLLTFVPITALVTLALGFAPRFAAMKAAGFVNWVREFPLVTAAAAVTAGLTVVIIVMCCKVLLAEPTAWKTLRADTTWLSKAFSEHAVGVPLFADSTAYQTAESKALTATASAAEQGALADTSRRILELSEAHNARDRFKRFSAVYVICTILIIAGASVVTATLPATPDGVTKPTQVAIFMPPGTENQFVTATGCTSLASTTAIAVGGLWNRPKLRLIGQGCPVEDWTPPENLGIVITPK